MNFAKARLTRSAVQLLVTFPLLWSLVLGDPAGVSAKEEGQAQKPVPATGAKGEIDRKPLLPPRVSANNTVELRKLLNRDVTVTGKVDRVNKSSSGHQFLSFTSSELTVVCFQKSLAAFKEGTPADLYGQREVEITGRLELYNGKLQIKLHQPAQIKLAAAKSETSPPAAIELKRIDKDTFLSPAGLRYDGYDPQGLTRVEHIARHTRDQPDRPGSHGVFDGDRGVAFAVIDEAWKLAEKNKIRPENEGDRSSYLVPLGRRVGYLGGQAGKRRNNPPLERVFIVFKTGTKDIITAFPR